MDDKLNYEVMKTLEDVIQDLTGHPNLEMEILDEAWLADSGLPPHITDEVMKLKSIWAELEDSAEFEDPQALKDSIQTVRLSLESDIAALPIKNETDAQKTGLNSLKKNIDAIKTLLNTLPETGTTLPTQNQSLKNDIENLLTVLLNDPTLDPLTITEDSLKAKG
jgi:hypothetical protein